MGHLLKDQFEEKRYSTMRHLPLAVAYIKMLGLLLATPLLPGLKNMKFLRSCNTT